MMLRSTYIDQKIQNYLGGGGGKSKYMEFVLF